MIKNTKIHFLKPPDKDVMSSYTVRGHFIRNIDYSKKRDAVTLLIYTLVRTQKDFRATDPL